ncbi:MAG TPA: PRC-barrel domain-containing protein [Thermoanaerobaculia bacterium]|nr:PRC-barrel domain-containing protein [Thermoanaerobaculia bacterium]
MIETKTTKNQPSVLSATTMIGDSVTNRSGEDLGKIEELMIDLGRGSVAYAVLSFGGVLGMGDKLFAIPFQALKLDADHECFVLDVDKEKLKKAPGFDKDHWPSTADRTWGSQIHSYYGYRPYWE